MKKKRIRVKLAGVTRVAQKYGLPGNYGYMAIATEVARVTKIQVPQNREDAKAIIKCQPEYENIGHLETAMNALRRSEFPKIMAKAASDEFLESYEWRRLRMVVLKKYGARCGCCGATPQDGLRMHVDHIKPRKLFPELALDVNNLQVLCEVCNHGKGNWDQTDWRSDSAANDSPEAQHIRSIMGEARWPKKTGGKG